MSLNSTYQNQEIFIHKGKVTKPVFTVTFPESEDFCFISHAPNRGEFFVGELRIKPGGQATWAYLPQRGSFFYQLLEGEVTFKVLGRKRHSERVVLNESGETLAFNGPSVHDIENASQEREARLTIFTAPSFFSH